jgi:hypothetical protein
MTVDGAPARHHYVTVASSLEMSPFFKMKTSLFSKTHTHTHTHTQKKKDFSRRLDPAGHRNGSKKVDDDL